MRALSTVVGLQYKAFRLPSQLVETRVIAPYVPRDNVLRLAFERVIGSFDLAAGRLLSDDELRDRGSSLRDRAAGVQRALEREQAAADRRAQEAAEHAKQQQLEEQEKARVQEAHEQQAAERKLEQELLARKAKKRQRPADDADVPPSLAILAAERDRLDAQEARIQAHVSTAAH